MILPSVTRLSLVASLGCLLSLCATRAAESEAPEATVQSADDQAAAELKEHHRHHHQGGVTQFIAMSLDTLGATDSKLPKIEKIQTDLHACMAPAARIEKTLHVTMADGIAAGNIDGAKVNATIAQLSAAAGPVHDCSAAALNELHAILSSTERWELVEKVQAHWEIWRQVDHEAEASGRESGGWLAELTKELSLTQGQVDKISAALHKAFATLGKFDRKKVDANVQAFAAAFVRESFDAKSITADATSRLAAQGAKRMAIFYETVTPLLNSEQRATLAEHLRQHANHQPVVSAR